MRDIIKEILTLMVVEHIRVRKSNSKAIEELLRKRSEPHGWLLVLVFVAVAVVALAGIVIVL